MDAAKRIIQWICFIGAVALLVWALATYEVHAQDSQHRPVCLSHRALASTLAKQYKEHLHFSGIAESGKVLELYISDDAATWTLIVLMSPEAACIVASGEKWGPAQEQPGEPI